MFNTDPSTHSHEIADQVRDGEPVKRPPRYREWTRDKMAAFLEALRFTQSVSRAARAAGMGRQSAYKLKKRVASFSAAWDEALADLCRTGSPAPLADRRPCPLCGAVRTPVRW